MTPDALRELCLAQPQAYESFPFGPQAAVIKASGNDKMFALVALDAAPPIATSRRTNG